MVDAFFGGVAAWEAGDDGDVAESDRKLVGDDASDAAVAVKEGVDADEIIVEASEEAADFVKIVGGDKAQAITEVVGEGVELIIKLGAAAGNVMEVFVPWCAETDVVTARA